jgi:hypothetical protein
MVSASEPREGFLRGYPRPKQIPLVLLVAVVFLEVLMLFSIVLHIGRF